MLKSIRFPTIRLRNGLNCRRTLALSLATTAFMMLPGAAERVFAADVYSAGKGQVSTDGSKICTYWMAPGSPYRFVLTDNYGNPMGFDQWYEYVGNRRFDQFLDRIEGLLWLSSAAAHGWLQSSAGDQWRLSQDGQQWIGDFAKSAPENKPTEYPKICSTYGVDYWFIPGTDLCVKLGSYLRQADTLNANVPLNYDELAKRFQAKAQVQAQTITDNQSKPADDDVLKDIAKTVDEILKKPITSPGLGTTTTSPQTTTPSTPAQTTTPQTSTAQTSTSTDQNQNEFVKVKIYVKGNVPEGETGQPVAEQYLKLTMVMPDGPDFTTTRTAQQENEGASSPAAQGKTGADGKVEFNIGKGDIKYIFNTDLKIRPELSYGLTGYVTVDDHGGYISETTGGELPKANTGGLKGVDYQWEKVPVGESAYFVRLSYSMYKNTKYTDEQVKQNISDGLLWEFGPNVRVVFEGDICRIELPGPWVPNYTPIPMKPGAGLPQATIKLNTASRRHGGAL